MSSTVNFKIEATFRVDSYSFKNEKYIVVDVMDITPEGIMPLGTLEGFKEEIQNWDILQEDITVIDIGTLEEEKEYQGTFDVELCYGSTYDSWLGTDEYEASITLNCIEHKERPEDHFSGLSYDREYSKIFHAVGNNHGDEIYMKLLPSGKIRLDYAHCTIVHRGNFVDVATLTACLAYHLYELSEKKEESE